MKKYFASTTASNKLVASNRKGNTKHVLGRLGCSLKAVDNNYSLHMLSIYVL